MKAKRVKVKNVKIVKLDLHLPVIAEEKLAAKGAQLLNEGQHW